MVRNSHQQAEELCRLLRVRSATVGFAESCTGGALSAAVTALAGVSDVYLGSVVSYSNEAKVQILGVHRDILIEEGAVSEKVARQMAHGVRRQLSVDWAVAITGVAGPSGGTSAKPVGLVCFAIVGPNIEISFKKNFEGDRNQIQHSSVLEALNQLTDVLRKQK